MKELLSFIGRLLKPLLIPLSLLYGLVIWLRNKVYDKGIYAGIEFSVPVISVGNLSTGGTGKTPHIEYIIRLLNYEYKVATMSRGYKRQSRGFQVADHETNALKVGDEPMQFHLKFPEVKVTVCEERMTGIPELMRLSPETEVVLLDDAYQHRSVKPGLNILITDYHKPFYTDHILPFGSLREGRGTYNRADIIIVSKCPPTMKTDEKEKMTNLIQPYAHQKVFFSAIKYCVYQDFFTREESTLSKDSKVILVCGIAKPNLLLEHIENQVEAVHLLKYPDHHYFSSFDLSEIKDTYNKWEVDNKVIVTTEKDAARLHLHSEKLKEWGIPIVVIPIEIVFLFNQASFDQQVLNYIQKEREENEGYY